MTCLYDQIANLSASGELIGQTAKFVKMQARSDKTASAIRATGRRIDGRLVVVGVAAMSNFQFCFKTQVKDSVGPSGFPATLCI